jgi:hypothetical protein
MKTEISMQRATADDAEEVAEMIGELLTEIMNAIGVRAFNFDLEETATRLKAFSAKRSTLFLSLGPTVRTLSDSWRSVRATRSTRKAPLAPSRSFTFGPTTVQRALAGVSPPRQSPLAPRGVGGVWRSQRHHSRSSTRHWRSTSGRDSQSLAAASSRWYYEYRPWQRLRIVAINYPQPILPS